MTETDKNTLRRLIEDLDLNALRAEQTQMTKTDFFDLLCEVTRSKFLAIKETR